MSLRDGEVDDVIAALMDHYTDGLTEWEAGFVTSVAERRERGEPLSPRQRTKLDEVFERVSDGGRRGSA